MQEMFLLVHGVGDSTGNLFLVPKYFNQTMIVQAQNSIPLSICKSHSKNIKYSSQESYTVHKRTIKKNEFFSDYQYQVSMFLDIRHILPTDHFDLSVLQLAFGGNLINLSHPSRSKHGMQFVP